MPDSRALVRYEHRSNDKYSKISLGAFDDNDEVEFLNSAPEPQSFGAGVVSILKKNGVPPHFRCDNSIRFTVIAGNAQVNVFIIDQRPNFRSFRRWLPVKGFLLKKSSCRYRLSPNSLI